MSPVGRTGTGPEDGVNIFKRKLKTLNNLFSLALSNVCFFQVALLQLFLIYSFTSPLILYYHFYVHCFDLNSCTFYIYFYHHYFCSSLAFIVWLVLDKVWLIDCWLGCRCVCPWCLSVWRHPAQPQGMGQVRLRIWNRISHNKQGLSLSNLTTLEYKHIIMLQTDLMRPAN